MIQKVFFCTVRKKRNNKGYFFEFPLHRPSVASFWDMVNHHPISKRLICPGAPLWILCKLCAHALWYLTSIDFKQDARLRSSLIVIHRPTCHASGGPLIFYAPNRFSFPAQVRHISHCRPFICIEDPSFNLWDWQFLDINPFPPQSNPQTTCIIFPPCIKLV